MGPESGECALERVPDPDATYSQWDLSSIVYR